MIADGVSQDPFSIPLLLRYPSLSWLPRARFGSFPTPVQEVLTPADAPLWIKRDDLSGSALGGNKVRALEFLLADVGRGSTVLTVGGRGSTHALATAVHARLLGARTLVVRWDQEMNADARAVARRIERTALVRDVSSPVAGMLLAATIRLTRRVHWIPAGGTSALGALGHVNAALELAEQIAARRLPAPARIVVPLGSGGTAAGLALGCAIAGLRAAIVCATVAPRVVANRARVLRVANRCARLIERATGTTVPRPTAERVVVEHGQYGGAYGRETAAGRSASDWLSAAHGVSLDATYSAKALAAALAIRGDGPTLFWLTYDARAAAADDGSAGVASGVERA